VAHTQFEEDKMTIALHVISILWIASGTVMVIYTNPTRKFFKKIFLRDNIKWMAILPIVFGVVLVVGAFYYEKMFWLALILGLLGLIKGAYIIILPSGRIKGHLEWWFDRASDGTIRLFGLITFIIGSAMLSYLM